MIHIVDFGMGNLGSISNMLKKIGEESIVTCDPREISQARKLILPGVGAFDAGMTSLSERGLVETLRSKIIEEKTPILGICLGMQLMTRKSEEGKLEGLGWIDGECVRFDRAKMKDDKLRIPHMAWNEVNVTSAQSLLPKEKDEWRFYFVHGYHVVCKKPSDIMGITRYGYEFVSAFHKENIYGVQFHPEKSHSFGMKLLERFAEI